VRSTKRRHHSPEWTILGHVSYFIQRIGSMIPGPAG